MPILDQSVWSVTCHHQTHLKSQTVVTYISQGYVEKCFLLILYFYVLYSFNLQSFPCFNLSAVQFPFWRLIKEFNDSLSQKYWIIEILLCQYYVQEKLFCHNDCPGHVSTRCVSCRVVEVYVALKFFFRFGSSMKYGSVQTFKPAQDRMDIDIVWFIRVVWLYFFYESRMENNKRHKGLTTNANNRNAVSSFSV